MLIHRLIGQCLFYHQTSEQSRWRKGLTMRRPKIYKKRFIPGLNIQFFFPSAPTSSTKNLKITTEYHQQAYTAATTITSLKPLFKTNQLYYSPSPPILPQKQPPCLPTITKPRPPILRAAVWKSPVAMTGQPLRRHLPALLLQSPVLARRSPRRSLSRSLRRMIMSPRLSLPRRARPIYFFPPSYLLSSVLQG